MPRKPDERIEKARQLFLQGQKLVDIARDLDLPEGTVRRWKSTHHWESERSDKNTERSEKKRGGQPGNKNAVGNDGGAPPENKNAEKYGFFAKYLPDETREIFSAIEQANPLDLLWHQIQIAYAAIIRAQRIAYVKDQNDMTKECIGSFDNGDTYSFQQAWDKQNEFLKAQARAQSELRSLIRQYDEMLHENWELSTEEQKARVEQLKARTEQIKGADQNPVEDKIRKLFEAIGGALDEAE